MFSRVIMDTGQWRISAGMFGFGAMRASNQSGETAIATATEKTYFLQVLRALRSAGVAIGADSPVATAVTIDFAKAIHQRSRRATASGGFAYAVFFSTYDADETARRYLEKYSG